jgi:hypothetical protein
VIVDLFKVQNETFKHTQVGREPGLLVTFYLDPPFLLNSRFAFCHSAQ